MADKGNGLGARFWVPILIMALISVVSVTTNVFLGSQRAIQREHIEKILTQQEKIINKNQEQDIDITRLQDGFAAIEDKLDEISGLIVKHMDNNDETTN